MINAALGYTHVFSPTFYMETIASQQWFQEQNNAGGTPTGELRAGIGLPTTLASPASRTSKTSSSR